eukprot:4214171-Pyramimonas_sp.AAC.1
MTTLLPPAPARANKADAGATNKGEGVWGALSTRKSLRGTSLLLLRFVPADGLRHTGYILMTDQSDAGREGIFS